MTRLDDRTSVGRLTLLCILGLLSGCSSDKKTTAPTDTTPPSAVTTLAVGSTTSTTATLTWTAVGDDEGAGTAMTYDLRYSTSEINAFNFALATQVTGEPPPKTAGRTERFTVTGLTAGTTYYFALIVADEIPNRSGLSNVPSDTTEPPPDTAPPSVVTTLAVASTTDSSATLTWTAVGDDGDTGTAATYDLRYSTALITADNVSVATQVTGETTPQAAGQPESFTVTGLTAGTTYFFALQVADEVPNWSALSNIPRGVTDGAPPPPDITPPRAVVDLAAGAATQASVVLSWTAPGDDGAIGTAAQYDLRYATAAITEANFGSATAVSGVPAPQTAEQMESFTVTGLTAGTTYWFALKTRDEAGNVSELSNVASRATTTPVPAVTLLVPARTVVGDTLMVNGRDFGSQQDSSAVLFVGITGRVEATILSPGWSATSIKVLVPAGAANGPVVVRRGGVIGAGISFQVAPDVVSYTNDLLPLFELRGCASCHGGTNGLFLDSRAAILQGNSNHGPVVTRRNGPGSVIVKKVRGTAGFGVRMPQGSAPLVESEILLISDWIDQGTRDN